jgi:hypothetical protein
MHRFRIYRITDDGGSRLVTVHTGADAQQAFKDALEVTSYPDLFPADQLYLVVPDEPVNPGGRQSLFRIEAAPAVVPATL